ncbi:unnamed protein product [Amoebophrya sp. A120]|nr:unnamed protein product [Amoebophrya sp. A120]|eukprot:GSA120T00023918001.1
MEVRPKERMNISAAYHMAMTHAEEGMQPMAVPLPQNFSSFEEAVEKAETFQDAVIWQYHQAKKRKVIAKGVPPRQTGLVINGIGQEKIEDISMESYALTSICAKPRSNGAADAPSEFRKMAQDMRAGRLRTRKRKFPSRKFQDKDILDGNISSDSEGHPGYGSDKEKERARGDYIAQQKAQQGLNKAYVRPNRHSSMSSRDGSDSGFLSVGASPMSYLQTPDRTPESEFGRTPGTNMDFTGGNSSMMALTNDAHSDAGDSVDNQSLALSQLAAGDGKVAYNKRKFAAQKAEREAANKILAAQKNGFGKQQFLIDHRTPTRLTEILEHNKRIDKHPLPVITIILPPRASSLINICNCMPFFEEHKWTPLTRQEKMFFNSYRTPKHFEKALFNKKHKFRIQFVDNASQIENWLSVCAVFLDPKMENDWQLNEYPFAKHVHLFTAVRGFFVNHEKAPVKSTICANCDLKELTLPQSVRHKDDQVLANFWLEMERFLQTRSHMAYMQPNLKLIDAASVKRVVPKPDWTEQQKKEFEERVESNKQLQLTITHNNLENSGAGVMEVDKSRPLITETIDKNLLIVDKESLNPRFYRPDFDLQRKRMGKPTLAEEQQALPIALKQKIEKGEKLTQKELNDLNKEGKVPDFDAEDENGFDWAAQPIAAHTLDIGAGRQVKMHINDEEDKTKFDKQIMKLIEDCILKKKKEDNRPEFRRWNDKIGREELHKENFVKWVNDNFDCDKAYTAGKLHDVGFGHALKTDIGYYYHKDIKLDAFKSKKYARHRCRMNTEVMLVEWYDRPGAKMISYITAEDKAKQERDAEYAAAEKAQKRAARDEKRKEQEKKNGGDWDNYKKNDEWKQSSSWQQGNNTYNSSSWNNSSGNNYNSGNDWNQGGGAGSWGAGDWNNKTTSGYNNNSSSWNNDYGKTSWKNDDKKDNWDNSYNKYDKTSSYENADKKAASYNAFNAPAAPAGEPSDKKNSFEVEESVVPRPGRGGSKEKERQKSPERGRGGSKEKERGTTSAASSSQNKFLFYEGRNENTRREDDVERYHRSSKYREDYHDKDDYNYRGGSKHKDYNQPSRYSRSRGRDRGARRSKEKEDERDRYDRRDRSRSKEVNKEENNGRGRSRYGNRRDGSKDKDIKDKGDIKKETTTSRDAKSKAKDNITAKEEKKPPPPPPAKKKAAAAASSSSSYKPGGGVEEYLAAKAKKEAEEAAAASAREVKSSPVIDYTKVRAADLLADGDSFKLDKAESVASKKEEEKKQVSVNMDEL